MNQNNQLFAHLDEMASLSTELHGHLTERETRFLALVASVIPPELGQVLEIGSFRGKSTTVLAISTQRIGGTRIVAVDPLTLPASTDPGEDRAQFSAQDFFATLEQNNVRDLVEFHQMTSDELAKDWNRPIRFLWIDGDHTYKGAISDINSFAPHCVPGAIVAFHDVLHRYDGPIRAFCEQVLLSSDFGPCGVCGSIGWSQRIASGTISQHTLDRKNKLYRQLSRLIPYTGSNQSKSRIKRMLFKFHRGRVPHGDVDAEKWMSKVMHGYS